MADPVDISRMPDPSTVGLAPNDPTNGMPDPATIYAQHYGYAPPNQAELDTFMRNPGAIPDPAHSRQPREIASRLTGLPRAAAAMALSVPAAAASVTGELSGALGAALDPDNAAAYLEKGRQRGRDWAQSTYNLSNYVPATAAGAEFSNQLLSVPSQLGSAANQGIVKPLLGENAAQAVGDVAQDVGTDMPILGAPGLVRGAVKGAVGAARTVKGALTPDIVPAGTAVAPSRALTPPVGQPVTGASLRAEPNPIPPPSGTKASAKPTAPATPQIAAPGAPPAVAPGTFTLPAEDTAPLDMSLSPEQRALVREGVAARRAAAESQEAANAPTPAANAPTPAANAPTPAARVSTPSPGGAERGSVRLFNSPKEEGPQETPNPEDQSARAGHLNAIDKLSGGMLPSRRASAISGDYNATGDDWQLKESGSKTMQTQIANENAALHNATDNVHRSIGSEFGDSVDSTTVSDRGRVTRGAIQGIEDWFQKATDGIYNSARAQNQDRPMPFPQRVMDVLNDDSKFVYDPEKSLQSAAKSQLQRMWSTGDPDKLSPPGSVNAAERFREWVNDKGKNPAAQGVATELKNAMDMHVAENGGPGLFETARAMRRHQYQMLEEPTGIKKLLAPADSQGINHAIPEHKVMDYIADLPREQHEHVLNVLKAGAHLDDPTGEIANNSAAAIREIQAHVVSRMHAAATDDGGKWNARGFYSAADRYARNAPALFKNRPDVVNNLQTLNDAGNTLHMDRHYPGAFAQGERVGGMARAVEVGGKMVASAVHDVPYVGRLIGRGIEHGVESATGAMGEASREKAATSRLVDRTGKMRGSVGVLPQRDAVEHDQGALSAGTISHSYRTPNDDGILRVTEIPGRGIRQVDEAKVDKSARGQGWGTRMLQRAADDAHANGQVLHSDQQVSHGQAGAYKNLAQLGYDVKMKPNENIQGTYQAHGDHVFEVRPGKNQTPLGQILKNQRGSVNVMNEEPPQEGDGSILNVGLHQGNEGQPGFRKMSKQEATSAIESTGAKVTKTSVLTPKQHGVSEPTMVASTDRPLSNDEMQSVLAKTKQSAIPQRAGNGDESMHVAPGHEQIAKSEGWDSFNPDYFREHSGQTMTDAEANPKNIHPDTTVTDPKRSAYPGIYDDPKEIASRVKTVPESPHLKDIFGTTRQEMHDAVIKRGDVAPKTPMPGMAPKGKGSAAAQQITTPENAERLRSTISAFKGAHPEAYKGMVAWYHMDPMYHSIKDILGGDAERAGNVYHKLNTYTALSSPMSSVAPEIRRGTTAATMTAEGVFHKYAEHGGNPTSNTALKNAPELATAEMGAEGHPFHSTAQVPAMARFTETGAETNAPKTGAYRRASDAPSRPGSEYQNTVLVGDSHFSRGAGLADVRGAAEYDRSIEGPELKVVHPWYHDKVAKPSKIPATSAQAAQWAALSHETGVETAIGAPKLEIWANEIASAAKKAGVTPKEMWRRIVKRLANG